MTKANDTLRNIAIIAHVDHGKTTLVDGMLKQSGLFRDNQEVVERLMDSMDLERERGITISAKNCSVLWKGIKINIIDTPGHADFGGEVERALSMADGALLLVDASEGPLPQTRFVVKKALDAGLKILVIINKIDRKDARPDEVLDEIYDLFIDLDATEEQLDFPLLYTIGRDGIAKTSLDEQGVDLQPLFNAIIGQIPAPKHDPERPFQMLVSDLGYSDYLGRLAVGKIHNGSVEANNALACINRSGRPVPLRVSRLQIYDGMRMKSVESAEAGDIVVLSGIEDVEIGDTVCTVDAPEALERIHVDEPTVSMRFLSNTSPFAGREGPKVQASKIRERLFKETLRNVAIQVVESEEEEGFIVRGRGEFQMAILIETMRREGFELCVGRPQVIFKQENGKRLEPIETLFIECDEEFMGSVTEKISVRRGQLTSLGNRGDGRVRMEFSVPSRALIGYRDEFLTDTKGTGVMNSLFAGYEDFRGDFPTRRTGSIVADREGTAVAYALFGLEPRGRIFVVPGDSVYGGMIVGEHNRDIDIDVNPCKEKKLTNMRASGKDENIMLAPVAKMNLEKAIHFIRDDELVEVTPRSIRLRKAELSAQRRRVMYGARKKEAA